MSKQHFVLKAVLLSSVAIAAVLSFSKNESKLLTISMHPSSLGGSTFTSAELLDEPNLQNRTEFKVARFNPKGFYSAENQQAISASLNSDGLSENSLFHSQSLSVEPPIAAPAKNQIINHIVKAGETLSSLWENYGASAGHAVQVMESLRDQGLARLGLRKGESVKVEVSPAGELLNFEKRLDDGRTLLVKRSLTEDEEKEKFEAEIVPVEVEESDRTVSGTIRDSLAASAQQLGISYSVVDDVVDLFSARIHFTKDIQPGDSFAVTFREKRSKRDGSLIGEPVISEASFIVAGKLMAVFGQEGKDSKMHFMDEQGSTIGNYFLRYPLNFTRISSYFTFARFHPVLQRTRPHLGVDFAAPSGTPVRSVGDGTIIDLGFKKEPGNWIKIQHNDRWSTAYMHLSAFAPGLKKGMRVSRGQLIGAVGSTGLATGPHLHFSLYDNGLYTNPLTTDLPQIDMDNIKMPKMVLTQKLEAVKALHERAKVLANNQIAGKPKV